MAIASGKNELELLKNDDLRLQEFTGVVVDSDDPLREYRCKIRVRGKFDELEVVDIPWAIPASSSFYGGSGGAGISYPKVGTEVYVTFFEGDIYAPQYHHPVEMEVGMLSTIRNSYVNSAVFHWDSDEGLRMFYTQSNGLVLNLRDSFLNFLENGNILIQHTDNQSAIELANGDITITSNNSTDVSSPNRISLSSALVQASGLRTELGINPIFSNVVGESIMVALKSLASAIDAKAPPTPGVTAALIESLEPIILSQTVKTSS
jgi:hypothetical protein